MHRPSPIVIVAGIAALLAGMTIPAEQDRQDIAHASALGSFHDQCLTALADPILTTMGMTGVDVRSSQQIPAGAAGLVDRADPTTVLINDLIVYPACGPAQSVDARTAVIATIAHEAAHVAQLRVTGVRGDWLDGLPIWAGITMIRRHQLEDRIGGDQNGVRAVERSAECAIDAFGFPGMNDPSNGYHVTCTAADLVVARTVIRDGAS